MEYFFYTRDNREKADEQAKLALEMMQCLDLQNLEQYHSHFPLIDSTTLIENFSDYQATNKDAFEKKKSLLFRRKKVQKYF
jgi:hypothetical protein